MIKKVILKNFKRFKNQTFDLDSNVVLAGQNNSGKTTLIQAISAWHFGLHKWLESGKRERAIPLGRKEFSPVPLQEFSQMWSNKSTGYKKNEQPKKHQGAPRPLIIEVVGEGREGGWSVEVEFTFQNKDQIYVKSNFTKSNIPTDAKELQIVHIPPFSGISIDEHEVNHAYQDTLIGQGKPGDILRNLLQEISEDDKDNWVKLCTHIKEIFGYELTTPSPRGSAYIMCQYRYKLPRAKHPILLDVNTAGSGFQQVLLLLAFLYARPGSVVLVDEPDAHLHINLQMEIFDVIKKINVDRGGQLIVTTHSEVLIDATPPENIIAFIGKRPYNLGDKHDRTHLNKAIRKLRAMDLLKVEQSGGRVLFLEAKSDFDILRAWARVLKHRASKWFENEQSYWVDMKGRNHIEAQDLFRSLQFVDSAIKGFIVVDSDLSEGGFNISAQNIKLNVWKRYEIENYLVHPTAIIRFVGKNINKEQISILDPSPSNAEDELKSIVPPAFFSDPLHDPSDFLIRTKASETILADVFAAANYPINKNEYFYLAEEMKPAEIHDDVKEMLDAIADHFEL